VFGTVPVGVVPVDPVVVVVAVSPLSPHAVAMSAAAIRLTSRSLVCRFT
jgi:hypothetical protein